MAEEDVSEAPKNQSAKGGGGSGMIPALLVIVLMPIMSFAMFKFMVIPMIKDAIPAESEHAPMTAEDVIVEHAVDGDPSYHVDFENVVTNVRGTSQTRFVQVSFTVYSANPELENEVEKNKVKMKNVAITILGSLTLADHERSEIKNVVRNQLKQGFEHEIGKPIIEEIYFSQFIVQ